MRKKRDYSKCSENCPRKKFKIHVEEELRLHFFSVEIDEVCSETSFDGYRNFFHQLILGRA